MNGHARRWPAAYITILLACGCENADTLPSAGRTVAPPVRDPSTPAEVISVARWTPDYSAARFFARPADSWEPQSLELSQLSLAVVVANGAATSTLDAGVTNPGKSQVEGVIQLPIPPGAAVTAATLWVEDRPVRGVRIGHGKARQVYDEIVGRRRDPLLVEWMGPELLNLSVFPIEPGQTRRLSITWVEPAVGESHWVPSIRDRETVVGYPSTITINGAPAERGGSWVAIPGEVTGRAGRYRLEVQRDMQPRVVAVVLDTSRGGGGQKQAQWESLERLVASLEGRSRVEIIAADWLVATIGSGLTASDIEPLRAAFDAIEPAGVFDHAQAIEAAAAIAGERGAIVVIGSHQGESLAQTKQGAQIPIYWLRDARSGPEPSAVPRVPPTSAAYQWHSLEAASGHRVWVGRHQQAATPGDSSVAPPEPLEALFHRAALRDTGTVEPGHIVSPATSILALESEDDYARWGIDPAKPSGGHPGTSPEPTRTISGWGGGWGSSLGGGGFGTIGAGSGTGSGYGLGSGLGHDAPVARIRFGNAVVKGSLDKNIVRRYVRRRRPQIQHCYERELLIHENIAGELTVGFVITPLGKTSAVHVTMPGENRKGLTGCVQRIVENLRLPRPQAGIAQVEYKLVLSGIMPKTWTKASATVKAGGTHMVRDLARQFGYSETLSLSELAWLLARDHLGDHRTPAAAYIVVASLFDRADPSSQSALSARRLLSEGCFRFPEFIAEQYRSWGLADDATRAETRCASRPVLRRRN